MMSSHSVANCRACGRASSVFKLMIIALISFLMSGCAKPRITQFSVTPTIFCPGTDIHISWGTEGVESVDVL